MRVTRITIDAELGIIELRTGPGGDGDYVLLPLELSPMMQRYITAPRDDQPVITAEEAPPWPPVEMPYSGLNESPAEARGNNPFGDFVKGVQTGTAVRGGIKYPTTSHSGIEDCNAARQAEDSLIRCQFCHHMKEPNA